MPINKIYISLLITLQIIFSGGYAIAQDGSGHKVNKVDSIKGASTMAATDEEYDTSSIVSGFKNKGKNTIQQVVIQRNLVGDTLYKIKSGDDFWYANAKPINKEPQQSKFNFLKWISKALSSPETRFVVWCILIGGLVFFFVFYLVNNETGLLASSKRKIKEKKPANALSDNILEIDFETALANSIASKDYRLSTRLLFLRLLKTMNDKKVIDYSLNKTNFDYLFHLKGTNFFNDFSVLMRTYEYTWYGEFTVGEQQYALIEKNFSQFQQQIFNLY